MNNRTTLRNQTINAQTSIYVFLAICVVPLFYLPIGFPDPFDFPKMFLWFISFFAILVIFSLRKLSAPEPIFLESNRSKDQNRTLLLLLLFVLSWFISTLFSVNKVDSLTGIVTQNGLLQLIVGGATFLLVANHYVFRHKHMILVTISYVLVSLLAILQFYRVDPFVSLYGEYVLRLNGLIFSTIGNQNQVATCLCVAYIVTAGYYIIRDYESKFSRFLLFGVFIIFAGTVATYSKAGLIAAGTTLLIALPLIIKNRIYAKRYFVVLAGSLMLYIVMSLTSNAVVLNRLFQMLFEGYEIIQGNAESQFGSGRVQIWINSIDLIKHYWMVGSGPDTFMQVYDAFGFNLLDSSGNKIGVLSPHNESLRLLATTGVASLVFYWLMIITILKNGFQKLKEDIQLMPFILGLICYEIKLMFNCSSIADIIFFWVLLAIVYSRANDLNKSGPIQ